MISYISSSDRVRPMRLWVLAFVSCLAAFAATFVAGTEWIIRTRVLPVDPFEKSLRVLQTAVSPNAVFGDSIVARGFLGRSDFVNLAYPADSWDMIAVKARAYFMDRKPGRIILAASHTELRFATAAAHDTGIFNDKGYRRIFLEKQRRPLIMLEPYHRQRLLAYWYTYFTKGVFVPAVRILDGGGMVSTDPAESAAWAAMPAATREHLGLITAAREAPPELLAETAGAARFRNLVSDLISRGAQICIVRFPATREFRATAAHIPTYTASRQWFSNLARDVGATFVDLWGSFEDDKYFADPTHMTPLGGHEAADVMVKKCFGS